MTSITSLDCLFGAQSLRKHVSLQDSTLYVKFALSWVERDMTVIADRVIVSDSFSNLSLYTILRINASTRGWNTSSSNPSVGSTIIAQGHTTSLIKSRTNNGARNKNWRSVSSFSLIYSSPTTNAGPSQAEQLLRVTSGIAAELIKAHDANESVSLNEIRARISKKYAFGGVPRLVDIISAIPDEYKKALLPKLKARPIRTASGVRERPFYVLRVLKLTRWDR